MSFINTPRLEFVMGSAGVFRLSEDFVYIDHCGIEHISKTGEITDGGTIPLLAEFLFKMFGIKLEPFGQGFPAYVIHDAECRNPDISRKEANDTLREMLIELGMDSTEVNAIYTGVEAYRVFHMLN